MDWEFQLLDWIQNLRNPILDEFFSHITHLGGMGGIFWILWTAVLLCIPKTRKAGMIMALALLSDLIICNGLLKPLFHRIRPYDVNSTVQLIAAKQKDFSFPSGHTAVSFAGMTALYLAKKTKMGHVALGIALTVAISRLYLYMHYPTDVLGGMIVGVIAGFTGYAVFKWFVRVNDKKNIEKQEEMKK